jgi:hypothetical protein
MKKPFGAPEVRDIRAWLESKYRFFICTVAFPEFGEEVIARMLEFGKPLSDKDFNYLRVADGATWPNAKRFLSVPTVGS